MTLPIITIPNDDNSSDISVLTVEGDVVLASDLIKTDPILKALISKRLKLMADGEEATPQNPQVRVARLGRNVFASLSFFCSKDEYGRRTSSSLVFDVSDKDRVFEMLESSKVPGPVAMCKTQLVEFIRRFNYRHYELATNTDLNSKKKVYW